MTVDVRTEAPIAASPDVVASVASDPDRVRDRYTAISGVERLTPPPLAAGTRLALGARFPGRRLADVSEVPGLERRWDG